MRRLVPKDQEENCRRLAEFVVSVKTEIDYLTDCVKAIGTLKKNIDESKIIFGVDTLCEKVGSFQSPGNFNTIDSQNQTFISGIEDQQQKFIAKDWLALVDILKRERYYDAFLKTSVEEVKEGKDKDGNKIEELMIHRFIRECERSIAHRLNDKQKGALIKLYTGESTLSQLPTGFEKQRSLPIPLPCVRPMRGLIRISQTHRARGLSRFRCHPIY